MKKCKKYIILILSILFLSFIVSSMHQVMAAGTDTGTGTGTGTETETDGPVGLDVLEGDKKDAYKGTLSNETKALAIGNIIVKVIRIIGTGIAIILLVIIGIRYVIGSVEEKAEYKQTLLPYVIGAVLLFGGATLTDIVYKAVTVTPVRQSGVASEQGKCFRCGRGLTEEEIEAGECSVCHYKF